MTMKVFRLYWEVSKSGFMKDGKVKHFHHSLSQCVSGNFFYTKNPISFPPNPSIQTRFHMNKKKGKYFLTKNFNLRMKMFEFHPGDLLVHSTG